MRLNRSGQCLILLLFFSQLALFSACSNGHLGGETAFVIPERLELRSTTARVARPAGELKRGDQVTIVERSTEGETTWAKLRGPDSQSGWTESWNLVSQAIVDQSRQLADSSKEIAAQAIGKSKARLKLRLTPDRSIETNVAMMVPAGASLEILDRQRRPRPNDGKADKAAGEGDEGNAPQQDLWYKVRLKDNPLLPAGYIYGGSVELDIPPEISFYASSGRRIVGWQKINVVRDQKNQEFGNYLVLERKQFDADEQSDFDRVQVLVYDVKAENPSYYSPFREDVRGRLPVALTMNGARGEFHFTSLDKSGQEKKVEYLVENAEGGRLKVTRPEKKEKKEPKRAKLKS